MAKSEAAVTKPLFFATPGKFRVWLERNHAKTAEQWIGFHKKASGRPSITWPESVDEALCFGWIDGLRKGIDEHSYMIRFTPRQARSTWSAVNIARIAELTRQKRMRPAGQQIFAQRIEAKSGIYAYEQRAAATLDQAAEARFRADPEAWAFFQKQPAWYRKTATWRIVSAKKKETRDKRLATLIEDCAAGRTIRELTRVTSDKRATSAR